MESFDSSPDYMMTTSKSDAKKEYYLQGGGECDDMISATSSTCGSSSVNGPHTPKLNDNVIKPEPTKNKMIKNFGNVKSFRRRRTKSRIIRHSPVTISDEDSLVDSSESSPHYLKATSCSQGKKTPFSESPNDKNSSKSKSASLGSSSLTNVRRVLIKKTSFKPKRGLSSSSKVFEDVAVTKATYSSTLRDSKFPEYAKLRSRGVKSEKKSATEICRYHHCSLHGHCHGAIDDPVSQPKRSLLKKRRSLRKQKSVIHKTGPGGKKRNFDEKKDCWENEVIPIVEQLGQDYKVSRDGYENKMQESDFFEVAFGETSFPGRAYEENLETSRKYSSYEQYGYCPRCSCDSCHNRQQVTTNPRRADDDSSSREIVFSIDQKPNEQAGNYVSDEKSNNKDCPVTLVNQDELTEKNTRFSSSSNSRTSSDVNSEGDRDSTPAGDFKETNLPVHESGKRQFSKPSHTSMWNLIHQHMSTNLAVEPTNKPIEGFENSFVAKESTNLGSDSSDDSENRDIELRKIFAIKLVREAIEKILLPEVQDQSSDDQSVTSESTPKAEILERNQSETFTEENLVECNAADNDESNVSSNTKQESLINDTEVKKDENVTAKNPDKKAPKHWSNLKKWIVLQRFIRELEKVKKFNPKKPNLLPLNLDPEAEKVNLRHLTVDGKRNTEEWMLDYALRQAVGQLAPTQKKKVALLVKAFETVAPTKEDEPSRIPRLKSDEPKSQDVQETIILNPVEEKTEESGPCVQKDHIKMWHMIYQHVVSNIAEKVGNQLLDGDEDDETEEDNETSEKNQVLDDMNSGFTKSDALKLVKEAVDEILVPESEDAKAEESKSKNWGKMKRLMLLKRSIRALERARKSKPQEHRLVHEMSDREPEKIELRRQMMDERKKAEQWMVDYAVQHIVTKLTPARKRRVGMLVEAFEAVVPLPEM